MRDHACLERVFSVTRYSVTSIVKASSQNIANMAWFHSFLAVSSVIVFTIFLNPASGSVVVTKPYPGHVVAIQGEQINVTCVIINPENDTTHGDITSIDFYKITDRFGGKTRITNGGKFLLVYKTDYFNGVPRWNGTMIINNITQAETGQYECRVNNTFARYGFGISYIEKKDLPDIQYSPQDVEVPFNVPVTLQCGLVRQGNKFSVKLVSIAWFKGNTKLGEIKHPEDESLKNINLTMNTPEDAGTYKCQLISILRVQREYTIPGIIQVKVKPEFTKESQRLQQDEENEIITKKGGQSVTMDCGARGNPIEIIWKKQARLENTRQTINQTVKNSTKYVFSSKPNKYEGFKLEILDPDYDDRGEYYCCIKSSNSSVPDQCQEFTVRVKDPLGWLWPFVGIICEAILIILILLIAAKCKAKKEENYKSDANTELSYTIDANEGSKGHIRLRNKQATTN